MTPPKEKTLKSDTLYEGKIITLYKDEAELPNGLIRPREVVTHPGGAVVLPILDDGRVVLVEQYRYSLKRHLLEAPAGKLDPGEEPFETIKRELTEETGYEAEYWQELTYMYPSPGFCNEKIWLYKATGLKKAEVQVREEDEFIELVILSREELFEKVRNRDIVDGKTLILIGLVFGFDNGLIPQ